MNDHEQDSATMTAATTATNTTASTKTPVDIYRRDAKSLSIHRQCRICWTLATPRTISTRTTLVATKKDSTKTIDASVDVKSLLRRCCRDKRRSNRRQPWTTISSATSESKNRIIRPRREVESPPSRINAKPRGKRNVIKIWICWNCKPSIFWRAYAFSSMFILDVAT